MSIDVKRHNPAAGLAIPTQYMLDMNPFSAPFALSPYGGDAFSPLRDLIRILINLTVMAPINNLLWPQEPIAVFGIQYRVHLCHEARA
jgi:hypothetical protein